MILTTCDELLSVLLFEALRLPVASQSNRADSPLLMNFSMNVF